MSNDEDSDWSEPADQNSSPLDEPIDTFESPIREPQNRHTPSQDSCCSNDTLFNLEELTCVVNESERELVDAKLEEIVESHASGDDALNSDKTLLEPVEASKDEAERSWAPQEVTTVDVPEDLAEGNEERNAEEHTSTNFEYVTDFLNHERSSGIEELIVQKDAENSSNDSTLSCNFVAKTVAPLPSPENIPWKQLPFSQLTYKEVVTNCDSNAYEKKPATKLEHQINEDDLVDINNLENEKLSIEYAALDQNESANLCEDDNGLREYANDDWGVNGEVDVLGDIRFTGPCDAQLMSTSFSESNDLGEEQGWDSGSDTRSSSSGEFIWKVRLFCFVFCLGLLKW